MIEKEEVYEIDGKKYTVITRCKQDSENIDKLYNILSKFIISKLN